MAYYNGNNYGFTIYGPNDLEAGHCENERLASIWMGCLGQREQEIADALSNDDIPEAELIWNEVESEARDILQEEIKVVLKEVRATDQELAPGSETILLGQAVASLTDDPSFQNRVFWQRAYNLYEQTMDTDAEELVADSIRDGNLDAARHFALQAQTA